MHPDFTETKLSDINLIVTIFILEGTDNLYETATNTS